MIRDALTKEVEFFEAKIEEEKKRTEGAAPERKNSGLIPLDQRPAIEIPVAVPVDRLAPVFEKFARKIMEVYNQPQELAVRQAEAFAAIKKLSPLTYGNENKIAARLDALIAERVMMESEGEELVEQPGTALVQRPRIEPASVTAVQPMSPVQPFDFFGQLKQMFASSAPPAAPDPLEGRSINLARVAKQSIVGEGEDED